MASTYSDLKIELITTGEQVGTWGITTNTNLGTALEEAIVGSADVTFSGSDVTLTLVDANSSQSARHVRLNLTGTSGGSRQLILGSGCQINKPYIVNNGLLDEVTVKNTTGTGVAVPAGKSMWVFNNGTNVVEVVTHAGSLSVGSLSLTSALPVASGGTGITSFGTGVATWLGTPSSSNLAAAVTDETGSGSLVFATSPTLVTPVLGTPTSGQLSNCTVDGTDAVGFRNAPVNSQSTAYTLVAADSGKTILHPASDNNARTFTIPANSSVSYPIGTVVLFINLVNTVTIAITSDTLILAGTGSTGSRTLAANGVASAVKVDSTSWIISGNGLT